MFVKVTPPVGAKTETVPNKQTMDSKKRLNKDSIEDIIKDMQRSHDGRSPTLIC